MENKWDYVQNPYTREPLNRSQGVPETDRYIALLDACSAILRQADEVISSRKLYTEGYTPDGMIAAAEARLASLFTASRQALRAQQVASQQGGWQQVEALKRQVAAERATRRSRR